MDQGCAPSANWQTRTVDMSGYQYAKTSLWNLELAERVIPAKEALTDASLQVDPTVLLENVPEKEAESAVHTHKTFLKLAVVVRVAHAIARAVYADLPDDTINRQVIGHVTCGVNVLYMHAIYFQHNMVREIN